MFSNVDFYLYTCSMYLRENMAKRLNFIVWKILFYLQFLPITLVNSCAAHGSHSHPEADRENGAADRENGIVIPCSEGSSRSALLP